MKEVTIFVLEHSDLMLLVSVLFTLAHAGEETWGDGAPFWRYYAGIARVRFPDLLGFLVITLTLPLTLIVLAYLGYYQHADWALAVLFGARLGDAVFSHLLPAAAGWRPNPGVWSSGLYVMEVVLAWLILSPRVSLLPFALGALPFVLLVELVLILRERG